MMCHERALRARPAELVPPLPVPVLYDREFEYMYLVEYLVRVLSAVAIFGFEIDGVPFVFVGLLSSAIVCRSLLVNIGELVVQWRGE